MNTLGCGDILYYAEYDEHILLMEETEMEDDRERIEPCWCFLVLEKGEYSWCWSILLEDDLLYRKVA